MVIRGQAAAPDYWLTISRGTSDIPTRPAALAAKFIRLKLLLVADVRLPSVAFSV